MDLHAGKYILQEADLGLVSYIDPYDIPQEMFTQSSLPSMLHPGQRCLLYTQEDIEVPEGEAWAIGLRSTWARLGLSAPLTWADPGFRGQLTMEVYNMSRYALLIREGDAIWNVKSVPSQEELYQGRYQDQAGIQGPKSLIR